ncbi:MAG: hypothetical protein WA160_02675 [Pseudobdellovibrio sp.]
MSSKVDFLDKTADLIETNPEIKSFIYQQVQDFNPFITAETIILVIARDPNKIDAELSEDINSPEELHRIAIILKEDDSSIEAEAFHQDIYEAIKMAKEKLVADLIEIQNELESPTDRLKAIQQANSTNQIH